MGNILGTIANAALGGVAGLLTGGPVGAAVGAVNGAVNGGGGPSGAGNITTSTDPTVAGMQDVDRAYEANNAVLQVEELRHQTEMQVQSQQFNDVEDEKSEQMREMNTLRDVAMKQRESDDKILKEFIKSAGGE